MKFWRWGKRRNREADLERELRGHLKLEAEDQQASGASPEEAAYAARRALGNTTQIKENVRAAWGFQWLETLFQDLRYGLRQLRHNPGFTAVAVLTLALGIGANTAIFSLIDAVMIRNLPVRNPNELIQLTAAGPHGVSSFSYPGFKRLRTENHVCSAMLAIGWLAKLDASINGHPETVEGRIVSANFFSVLGVGAAIGRTFTAADNNGPAKNAVAVISYGYWKRRFGLDLSILGKSITLNRTPFTIVGVTRRGFSGPEIGYSPDIYVPMSMEPAFHGQRSWLNRPEYHWLRIIGRLKPGVGREQARADLQIIYRRVLTDIPMKGLSPRERKDYLSYRLEVRSAESGIDFGLPKEFPQTLFILMSMVGLVMLVACANIANLLLGRATIRQKEIAVRLAIGAGRFRLIRQLLTEGAMLAIAAGAFGLVCAYWGADAIIALMSVGRTPLVVDLHPDLRVLGFTAAISCVATILFGLAPAVRGTGVDLTPALKKGAGGSGSKRSRLGLAKGLVALQVALSLLLLFGAGLFVQTLENLQNLDPGFERKGVLLFEIDPAKSGYKGPAIAGLYRQILERVHSLPGVRSASLSEMTPITGGGGWDNAVRVEGYTPRPDENTTVDLNAVGPDFFKTLGTPLVQGREFGPQDTEKSPLVAIINQAMARYFFGNRNPIGRTFGWWEGSKSWQKYEIVGVVKDAKYTRLRDPAPRTAYLDCFQVPLDTMTFEVRTSIKPTAAVPQVLKEIRAIDAGIRVGGFTTLQEHLDDSLGHEQLMATLSGLFAALALLLACVGLYGIMAYNVARRTNEIGIRMALGANRVQVLRTILGESAFLVAAGVAVGLPVALAAARLISAQLYGLTTADPETIVGATLLLGAVATFAAYIPARRATKVDPMVALRYE